jgi:hypothetical protein
LKTHPHKQCIIKADVLFLNVSFSHTSHSEFLALAYNIPRMIVSGKKKIKNGSGTYSSGNLPMPVITIDL